MADPLGVAGGVLAVGGSTLKASVALHELIRSFQSQNKDARALKAEVSDLNEVLASLLETVASNPTLDLKALELPLQRCGHACEDYRKIVDKCTQHSGGKSRSSVRDWITQKYLQGDINDFRATLAIYKSTINIALANANLRIAAVSPEVLDNYKDMILDTRSDLDSHLNEIQQKIDRLQAGDAAAADEVALEWHSILEEKECTVRGLDMCAQLSAQIIQYERASTEHAQFSDRPSAHKYVRRGLGEVGSSLQSLVSRLKSHEASIGSQLEAISLKDGLSEPVTAQLARLQQAKESISQCIQIVSNAQELADERSNIFEDITLTENSYALSVSTVNDLVIARRLNLSDRSRHLGGQVNDETVQRSIEALTQLDAQHLRMQSETVPARRSREPGSSDSRSTRQFDSRFGPGFSLAEQNTNRSSVS